MSIPFIDLKSQYNALKTEINDRIQKVLDHGLFILGPEVLECEKELAKYVGVKHALTCASGTDALMLALMAFGVKPGDEVITTSFTFVATAEIPVLMGLKPVLVDIEPDTFNIDVSKIEKAITKKTKVIMPVSLYGQPADMDAINALAKKHGLFVIEDAAQSFGGTYKGKKSCNLSDIGCTSFFPAKPLGCYGDGGAVFTNNDEWARIMTEIRAHGQQSRYHHTSIGFNARLDTLQCAILLPKLARFPWEVERRQAIAERYNQAFKKFVPQLRLNAIRTGNTSVWAQYTLALNQRDALIEHLKSQGIPTSVHYPKPIHQQPAYVEWGHGDLKQSELAAQQVVSLPMYPDMDIETQDKIIAAVSQFFEKLS